jgi:hypothetical protein
MPLTIWRAEPTPWTWSTLSQINYRVHSSLVNHETSYFSDFHGTVVSQKSKNWKNISNFSRPPPFDELNPRPKLDPRIVRSNIGSQFFSYSWNSIFQWLSPDCCISKWQIIKGLYEVFHASHHSDELNPRPGLDPRTVRSITVITVLYSLLKPHILVTFTGPFTIKTANNQKLTQPL